MSRGRASADTVSEPRLPRFTGWLRPLVDGVAGLRLSVTRKLLFGFLIGAVRLVGMAFLSLVVIGRMSERVAELDRLRDRLGGDYPRVFVILGNDDARWNEELLQEATRERLLSYLHGRKERIERWTVYGYSYVPPTPFRLKDWERYDVSRYLADARAAHEADPEDPTTNHATTSEPRRPNYKTSHGKERPKGETHKRRRERPMNIGPTKPPTKDVAKHRG